MEDDYLLTTSGQLAVIMICWYFITSFQKERSNCGFCLLYYILPLVISFGYILYFWGYYNKNSSLFVFHVLVMLIYYCRQKIDSFWTWLHRVRAPHQQQSSTSGHPTELNQFIIDNSQSRHSLSSDSSTPGLEGYAGRENE